MTEFRIIGGYQIDAPDSVYFYRAREERHHDWDENYEVAYYRDTGVLIERYRVMKFTPKGAWIEDGQHWKSKRFIRLEASKRFACSTVEEALISFRARKSRQLQILHAQIRSINDALKSLDKAAGKSDILA